MVWTLEKPIGKNLSVYSDYIFHAIVIRASCYFLLEIKGKGSNFAAVTLIKVEKYQRS